MKSGSLQRFVRSDGISDEVSPSLLFPADVQRIAILDLRIFNLDRNNENLLLRKSAEVTPLPPGRRASGGPPCYHLTPIDHASSLPPTAEGAFFEWQHWAHAKLPLSAELLDAIAGIDVDEEVELLRALGLEERSLAVFVAASLWLKIGAAAGLSLHQLAGFVAAPLPSQPALLAEVLRQLQPLEGSSTYRRVLEELLREAAALIAKNQAN